MTQRERERERQRTNIGPGMEEIWADSRSPNFVYCQNNPLIVRFNKDLLARYIKHSIALNRTPRRDDFRFLIECVDITERGVQASCRMYLMYMNVLCVIQMFRHREIINVLFSTPPDSSNESSPFTWQPGDDRTLPIRVDDSHWADLSYFQRSVPLPIVELVQFRHDEEKVQHWAARRVRGSGASDYYYAAAVLKRAISNYIAETEIYRFPWLPLQSRVRQCPRPVGLVQLLQPPSEYAAPEPPPQAGTPQIDINEDFPYEMTEGLFQAFSRLKLSKESTPPAASSSSSSSTSSFFQKLKNAVRRKKEIPPPSEL